MNSKAALRFWKLYNQLSRREQQRVRKAYQIWKANPNTPGLRFKRVNQEEPIYSVRVSDDYRVLGLAEGDTIVWFWVGRHDEYLRILKG
jgi:hypothetical protein